MKNTIKRIYEEAFGCEEDFFETLYTKAQNHCKVLIKDGSVVSFFFLLPVELKKLDKRQMAYYLFAAATDKKFQGNGYMSELIKKTITESEHPIILKPATHSLISFYNRFGFSKIKMNHSGDKNFSILPIEEFKELSPDSDELEGEFTACIFGKTDFDIDGITFEYTME